MATISEVYKSCQSQQDKATPEMVPVWQALVAVVEALALELHSIRNGLVDAPDQTEFDRSKI